MSFELFVYCLWTRGPNRHHECVSVEPESEDGSDLLTLWWE